MLCGPGGVPDNRRGLKATDGGSLLKCEAALEQAPGPLLGGYVLAVWSRGRRHRERLLRAARGVDWYGCSCRRMGRGAARDGGQKRFAIALQTCTADALHASKGFWRDGPHLDQQAECLIRENTVRRLFRGACPLVPQGPELLPERVVAVTRVSIKQVTECRDPRVFWLDRSCGRRRSGHRRSGREAPEAAAAHFGRQGLGQRDRYGLLSFLSEHGPAFRREPGRGAEQLDVLIHDESERAECIEDLNHLRLPELAQDAERRKARQAQARDFFGSGPGEHLRHGFLADSSLGARHSREHFQDHFAACRRVDRRKGGLGAKLALPRAVVALSTLDRLRLAEVTE